MHLPHSPSSAGREELVSRWLAGMGTVWTVRYGQRTYQSEECYWDPLQSVLRSLNFEMSFWCLQFPPKNEQKQVDLRFHSSKVEFVRLFFGGNVDLKKSFRFFLTFSWNSIYCYYFCFLPLWLTQFMICLWYFPKVWKPSAYLLTLISPILPSIRNHESLISRFLG